LEFQIPEDTVPSAFITEELSRQLVGRPPASGAWRDGDPSGDRQFAPIPALRLENGKELVGAKIAYET
jgi:homoserine O-acetyltransferase